jgi:hypothetical protein
MCLCLLGSEGSRLSQIAMPMPLMFSGQKEWEKRLHWVASFFSEREKIGSQAKICEPEEGKSVSVEAMKVSHK